MPNSVPRGLICSSGSPPLIVTPSMPLWELSHSQISSGVQSRLGSRGCASLLKQPGHRRLHPCSQITARTPGPLIRLCDSSPCTFSRSSGQGLHCVPNPLTIRSRSPSSRIQKASHHSLSVQGRASKAWRAPPAHRLLRGKRDLPVSLPPSLQSFQLSCYGDGALLAGKPVSTRCGVTVARPSL